jgi:hypothetical protein
MSGRLARSWDLVKASVAVLRADKELLVLPVLSGLAGLAVLAGFSYPAIASGWLQRATGEEQPTNPLLYLWSFGLYLALYFVTFFFNAALVCAALERLRGGDPTLRSALGGAASRTRAILGYALIAATVGILLRMIADRSNWVGKLVVGLIGVAWTLATALVVPVLVAQNVGPVEAVKRSASLLKKTWGENVIGTSGIGLVFLLLFVAAALVVIVLVMIASKLALGETAAILVFLSLAGFLLLAVVQSALQAIYTTALYLYAESGQAVGGFGEDRLAAAFRPK